MTRCANSHPPDETCADCAPPPTRDDAIAHIKDLRRIVRRPPAIDEPEPDDEERTEQ